jgi:carboxypeptidase C (cathepsin A)
MPKQVQDAETSRQPEVGGREPLKTPREERAQTRHTVVIGGVPVHYTATAGTVLLKDEDETIKASVFYVTYTRDGIADASRRPLTFSFNGGPGSSSVWMHLGLLGPRRVLLNEEGSSPPPPYRLVDNAYSLLDVTDLVFVDPVSTGYSRAAEGEKADQFHGYQKDIESVGEFIRLLTTRMQRWVSPKFLIGESYGTTRAAGLSDFLQDRHGLVFNGIMLISTILNFQTARFDTGNDLPFSLFLPTYTATAWYHRRLPQDLQADLRSTLREVEHFALTEYILALMKGAALPEDERADTVRKLARYTGLAPSYIEQADLRINIMRFVKELLRGERRTVGRLDSRFKGIDRDAAGEQFEFDPSLAAIQGPYTATFNDYVRGELRYESDLPYEILANLYESWDFGRYQNQYLNVAETLRQAMSKNPYLQIFVANGYFDLATPYFATDYTINHLGIDPSLHENITMTYYEAGHMMYIHLPSLAQIKQDLTEFILSATHAG